MADKKNEVDKVQELFNLGAHLGHKKNRLHPKARKYLYKIMDSISIIDLTITVSQLEKAKQTLSQLAAEGKLLLVVATKKVANQFTAKLCEESHIPSVTTKWLPGLLTNFNTLIKNEKKLSQMKLQRDNGEWDKFVKHERLKMSKEVSKLEKFYGGLMGMIRKPDALLVLDIKKEKNSVNEAKKNNIPVIAFTDTNSNPDEVKWPIVVNDDAPVVVEYVMKELIEAYTKGRPSETKQEEAKKII
ncbi:30S ribosomal protein S2 [Candidatus Roizmanbacteria bacterium RIFCSPLOWO2_01_FULL_41_22]|uniref:Small ribosomal subunit protein uS2 n=2 Tax=Candidatus Roizmaniibacteriota TaxID=1752723 RepID=A0A1F7JQI5_9BACT|nr:MAG: 30S ribosomal protein S2 [Candidatus Roizmanbacteria bacterium RIFCSPLOWO2_01_FULL_41_22]OGK57873.1 MAG: 30S ribosomal protein S2 [Candidatus Roizmanbacteria bacterium RIFCSPLOWO2_02_FULL_41_9]